MNKLAASYEHIEPEKVGNHQRVLVGELAGRANIMLKARTLGLEARGEIARGAGGARGRSSRSITQGYEFEAADASFELLVRKALGQYQPFFELVEYHVSIRKNPAHNFDACEATIKLSVGGEKLYTVAEGDGPVNALDAALRRRWSAFTRSSRA